MKTLWWKVMGLGMVLFSIIVGLSTPLSSGIVHLSPEKSPEGRSVTLEIHAVNSHYLSHPGALKVAFLSHGNMIPLEHVRVLNDHAMVASAAIPQNSIEKGFPSQFFDLAVYSQYDGLSILRQAFEVLPTTNANPTVVSSSASTSPLVGIRTAAHFVIQRATPQYFSFPYRDILYESIRNLFFHVAMWPVMLVLFTVSVIFSLRYLKSGDMRHDMIATESVHVGLLFGVIGAVTGSVWARFTWGDWWPNDPKLNGTAISILLYFAYVVLRNSMEEEQKKARVSAVYNIFSFPMMLLLILILPRLTDSLHPGNGGNPGFNTYDLDSHLRIALYPAFIGWILIGVWIMQLRYRMRKLETLAG